ncbi:MAG: hypothetical protein ACREK8_10660 [Gemmatimonadales bacterium]
MSSIALLALTALAATAAGCGPESRPNGQPDSALLAERGTRLAQRLAHPDSDANAPLAQWDVADPLQEISGLALTSDGRLLAHNDSRGIVVQLDYRRGAVVKRFMVGNPTVHGDFEAITTMGDSIILLTSDGVLYRFAEGRDGASVPYVRQDTGLGDQCEFEGMAYDPSAKVLLLACKHAHAKALKDSLVIFRWPVATDDSAASPAPSHLAVSRAAIIGSNDWSELHPSDLTIDPFTGNYVLVAAREQALFEITPTGALVFSRPLPPGHAQAEGVAITRDSILMISDEAHGGPALLTLYRWTR